MTPGVDTWSIEPSQENIVLDALRFPVRDLPRRNAVPGPLTSIAGTQGAYLSFGVYPPSALAEAASLASNLCA